MKTLRALTRKQGLVALGAAAVVLILVFVLVVVNCGGASHKTVAKKPAAHRKAAPLTKRGRPAPLTGVPDPSGASFKRSAITVKIDNTTAGKPQWGVDQADVVYEEVVEGGITRLAAVFNSHAPTQVGPVRSVRKTDQSIVWPIGGIYAYSGGADYAIQSIDTAPVKQLDETRAGSMMLRDHSRAAPWNLYAHVDQMFGAGGTPVPPPSLFTYRAARAKVSGTPATMFTVGFVNGYATTWTWDARSGTWLRSKFGAPDVEAAGVRLAPKNVVVMFVQYLGGNAQGLQAEAQLTGTGNAWVFTGGKVVKGTWSRADKTRPAQLTDAKGAEIRLAPGQTWVELPDVSYPVTIISGRAH